jgi:filamentous hemagglutinin family protein
MAKLFSLDCSIYLGETFMLCSRWQGLGIELLTVIALGLFVHPASAQLNAAVDGTGTTVNTTVSNQFDITEGTRSGNNLFHSFQQFNVGASQTANFVVPSDVQNVLARVSGGAVSMIDGRLQVTGGNSNLYLMNPAGIVFGNNAQLNLPAAFVATTANGIGFGDRQWFSASGQNTFTQLVGSPRRFAFTENRAGVIVVAGKLSTAEDQPLALIGGTIVATQSLETNGALALTTVKGVQVVEFTLPGQELRLAVKVNPIRPGDGFPNRWTIPIVTLPELITGGDVKSATQIRMDGNGQILLTATSSQSVTVKSGDIVVDSIKIFNKNGNNNVYDVLIDAQNTFRVLGTLLPEQFINSNRKKNENVSLPISIRTIGDTTIRHGGQVFVEAIGFQRDAKGVVIQDDSSPRRRVFLNGQSNVDQLETAFKYEDTGEPFDQDTDGRLGAIKDPTFNPSQDYAQTSYTSGLIVRQDSRGNGTLLSSLQDSQLSGNGNIQITEMSRLDGLIAEPPKPRPEERNCRSEQQVIALSPSRSSNRASAGCSSGQGPGFSPPGQILQILPLK